VSQAMMIAKFGAVVLRFVEIIGWRSVERLAVQRRARRTNGSLMLLQFLCGDCAATACSTATSLPARMQPHLCNCQACIFVLHLDARTILGHLNRAAGLIIGNVLETEHHHPPVLQTQVPIRRWLKRIVAVSGPGFWISESFE
jgi:hypothetical protein